MHTCIPVADEGNIYDLLDRLADYGNEYSAEEARFDYFGVGGVFAGSLPLKQPGPLRKWFGLVSFGQTTNVSVARKSEIDQEAFLTDPPAALFFQGLAAHI